MLPDSLRQALESLADHHRLPDLRTGAEYLRETYRTHRAPANLGPLEALAYGLTRFPATFGAITRALAAIEDRAPGLLESLKTVLDLGAGPGTLAQALQEVSPVERTLVLLEKEPEMRALAHKIGMPDQAQGRWVDQRLPNLNGLEPADFVSASYCLNELPSSHRDAVVAGLYQLTGSLLLLVEPGTPQGAAILHRARQQLLELGGTILAPCPHAMACPLAPDPQASDARNWCHFSVRISRSVLQMKLKQGSVPFEDEPYSYLAILRPGAAGPTSQSKAMRLLDAPRIEKSGASFRACRADGAAELLRIARRDKNHFRAVRRLDRGDYWDGNPASSGAEAEMGDLD